jgi:hypothetical protein
VSGKGAYTVTDDRDPVAAPEWLLAPLRALASRVAGGGDVPTVTGEPVDQAAIPGHLAELLKIMLSDGQGRHRHFYRIAAEARRAGYSQGQIVTLAGPWCAMTGKFTGRVETQVAAVWGKLDAEARSIRFPPAGHLDQTDNSDTPVEHMSETHPPVTSETDTSDSSDSVAYEMRDGPWLDAQQFPPLTYTVPGLMPAGLGIIAAPPKAGKSLLILDWLLAVAGGGYALGALRTGPARDVVYLALEDGDRRLQDRCRHLLAEGEEIPERFRYILAVPPGQVLAVLADALGKYPETALIVIDTLGRIMPLPQLGETTYQRDYRVAVAIKRIAEQHPGLTIIVIHHTRKAFSDDFIDSISGTHGLAGAADTIIALSRGRGKGDGVLRVTGRDVIEASYAVTFHEGVWALDGDNLAEARANVTRRADAAALSGRSAEILDFIRQYPAGATAKQVTDKFGKDAGQYLARLLASERLSKPKRGVYVVSELSEVSESQLSDGAENHTGLLPLSEVSEISHE